MKQIMVAGAVILLMAGMTGLNAWTWTETNKTVGYFRQSLVGGSGGHGARVFGSIDTGITTQTSVIRVFSGLTEYYSLETDEEGYVQSFSGGQDVNLFDRPYQFYITDGDPESEVSDYFIQYPV